MRGGDLGTAATAATVARTVAALVLLVTLAACGATGEDGDEGADDADVAAAPDDGDGADEAAGGDAPVPDPSCDEAANLLAAIDAGVEHDRLLPDLPTIAHAYRSLAEPLDEPSLLDRADHAAAVIDRIGAYVDDPPWGEADGIEALRVDEPDDQGGTVQGFASFQQQLAAWAHVTPALHRPVLDDTDALADLDCDEEVVAALGAPHRREATPRPHGSAPSQLPDIRGWLAHVLEGEEPDGDEISARCRAILADWDGQYGYSLGDVWSTTCLDGDRPEGSFRTPVSIDLTTSPYTDLTWLAPVDEDGPVTVLAGRGGYDPDTGVLGPDDDGEVSLAAAIDRDQGAAIVITVPADEPTDPVVLLERTLDALRDVPVSDRVPAWPDADAATGPDEPLGG